MALATLTLGTAVAPSQAQDDKGTADDGLVTQRLLDLAHNKSAGPQKRADAWLALARRGFPAKVAVPAMADFLLEMRASTNKAGRFHPDTVAGFIKLMPAFGTYGAEAAPAAPLLAELLLSRVMKVNYEAPEVDVNAAAAVALGRTGTPKALEALVKAASEDKAEVVRSGCIEGLAWLALTRRSPAASDAAARLKVIAETDESPALREKAATYDSWVQILQFFY
jgi:HEAT repeat protein